MLPPAGQIGSLQFFFLKRVLPVSLTAFFIYIILLYNENESGLDWICQASIIKVHKLGTNGNISSYIDISTLALVGAFMRDFERECQFVNKFSFLKFLSNLFDETVD